MTNLVAHHSGGFTKPATKRFSLSHLRRLAQLRQQRAALRQMDATRLADLGISQREAAIEAAKPLWDVPSHWQN